MSMNKGQKGVHVCRVARDRAPVQGKRLSVAERNQRLRAMAERLKGSRTNLADANQNHPNRRET